MIDTRHEFPDWVILFHFQIDITYYFIVSTSSSSTSGILRARNHKKNRIKLSNFKMQVENHDKIIIRFVSRNVQVDDDTNETMVDFGMVIRERSRTSGSRRTVIPDGNVETAPCPRDNHQHPKSCQTESE